MDVKQQAMQLRKVIREAAWPRGSQEVVVGRTAYLSPAVDSEDLPDREALALLGVGTSTPDQEDPRLVTQTYPLLLAKVIESDPIRESSLVGAGRSKGVGSSAGKSVIEIERPILKAVRSLTGADGIPILVSLAGSAEVAPLSAEEEVVGRQFTLSAVGTSDPEWQPAQDFTAVGTAPVVLSWRRHAGRYDYREVVLVRKAGSSGPVDVTDGTEVLRDDAATYSDTPGAGTWSYGIFVRYSEREGSDDTVYSDPLYRTVTVP